MDVKDRLEVDRILQFCLGVVRGNPLYKVNLLLRYSQLQCWCFRYQWLKSYILIPVYMLFMRQYQVLQSEMPESDEPWKVRFLQLL